MGVYSRIVESVSAREPAGEPDGPRSAPGDLGEVVDDVGERIQEIVDAAERVGALTESLGFRIESLQREAQALVDVLDQARHLLSGLAVDAAPESRAAKDVPSAQSAPEPRSRPQSPRPRPVPDIKPASEPQPVTEQAILRATQMAVAGTDRTEIEQMLRAEFGVTDPARVLDQMLPSERT